MNKFSIEDDVHAEWQGDFDSFDEAIIELQRRSEIPWDTEPNVCPCSGWETCERLYKVTEFIVGDKSYTPQREAEVLSVSSKGVFWLEGYEKYGKKNT